MTTTVVARSPPFIEFLSANDVTACMGVHVLYDLQVNCCDMWVIALYVCRETLLIVLHDVSLRQCDNN